MAPRDVGEIEEMGRVWQARTDEYLIGYVNNPDISEKFHSTPAIEMQRRLLVAIREFNLASGKQATVMIWLTVLIAALTVAILGLTAVMVWKG